MLTDTGCCGDFSGMGFDPVRVLERMAKLPNAVFTRGNHDRYIVTGERPGSSDANVLAHLSCCHLCSQWRRISRGRRDRSWPVAGGHGLSICH